MFNEKDVRVYRLVPDYHMDADSNLIVLGSILANPNAMEPLNRFDIVPPGRLECPKVVDADCYEVLNRVRQFDIKGWVEFFGAPAEASVGTGTGENRLDHIECDSIITSTFDPDRTNQYIGQCINTKPVRDWLGQRQFETLYLVTGIKVAHGLKLHHSADKTHDASLGVRVADPVAGAFNIGAGVGFSVGEKRSMGRTVLGDRILAIRLKKYTWRPKHYLFGEQQIKEGGFLDGSLQGADDEESDGSEEEEEDDDDDEGHVVVIGENENAREMVIREGLVTDELAAQVLASERGEKECFVFLASEEDN